MYTRVSDLEKCLFFKFTLSRRVMRDFKGVVNLKIKVVIPYLFG